MYSLFKFVCAHSKLDNISFYKKNVSLKINISFKIIKVIIYIIMGKCETSTGSIGIKILLSDLILQINEKNFNLIKEI